MPGWSEVVKQIFDEDRDKRDLRVLIPSSSSLAIQRGLSESLAGRFELLRAHHWNLGDMEQQFQWSLEQFLQYGGYPDAARFISDPQRWHDYLKDSIIEPVLGRDLALASSVPKLSRQRSLPRTSWPQQESRGAFP